MSNRERPVGLPPNDLTTFRLISLGLGNVVTITAEVHGNYCRTIYRLEVEVAAVDGGANWFEESRFACYGRVANACVYEKQCRNTN